MNNGNLTQPTIPTGKFYGDKFLIFILGNPSCKNVSIHLVKIYNYVINMLRI